MTAAGFIRQAVGDSVKERQISSDLRRPMDGAAKLKTSEYATAMIENMG